MSIGSSFRFRIRLSGGISTEVSDLFGRMSRGAEGGIIGLGVESGGFRKAARGGPTERGFWNEAAGRSRQETRGYVRPAAKGSRILRPRKQGRSHCREGILVFEEALFFPERLGQLEGFGGGTRRQPLYD